MSNNNYAEIYKTVIEELNNLPIRMDHMTRLRKLEHTIKRNMESTVVKTLKELELIWNEECEYYRKNSTKDNAYADQLKSKEKKVAIAKELINKVEYYQKW